jgi:uncharacterized cupin superfamily protein
MNARSDRPGPIEAMQVEPLARSTNYPKAVLNLLRSRLTGRTKRALGDHFGLRNFGVNLTQLAPGGVSSLSHAHLLQDELVYVVQGTPTLCTDKGHVLLQPGMCMGFKAGTGQAHCLRNDSASDVFLLEVGDRSVGDVVTFPDEDLRARIDERGWLFTHSDGTPFTDPAP